MRELEERSGVNREVIRIMLREGLLPAPVRRGRNSAEYDESHVRAIAAVRDLQRQARLTLREIKQAMNGSGTPLAGSASTYAHIEDLLERKFGLEQAPFVSLAALAERCPEAERDARAFADLGMLAIVNDADGSFITLTDARLVEIWAEIRSAGFVEERGFPPGNIAFYLEAAEFVAAREAAIFFDAGSGEIDEASAARMLHKALPLMLDFLGLLRVKAFMRQVRSRIHAGEPQPSRAPAST